MPLARTGQHSRVTSEETLDLVRRLAVHYNDATIAQILGQQGRRAATGLTWTKTHISQLRALPPHPPIPARHRKCHTRPRRCTRDHHHPGGTRARRVHRDLVPVAAGRLPHRRTAHPRRAVAIRIDQQLRDRITAQAPAGWVTLAAAAQILGIAWRRCRRG